MQFYNKLIITIKIDAVLCSVKLKRCQNIGREFCKFSSILLPCDHFNCSLMRYLYAQINFHFKVPVCQNFMLFLVKIIF